MGTYKGNLPFCECRWGGDGTCRRWGHLNTTCHNQSPKLFELFALRGGREQNTGNVWPCINARLCVYTRPSINARPFINARPGIKPWKTIMVQTSMLHCNGTNTVMVKMQGLTLNPGQV